MFIRGVSCPRESRVSYLDLSPRSGVDGLYLDQTKVHAFPHAKHPNVQTLILGGPSIFI